MRRDWHALLFVLCCYSAEACQGHISRDQSSDQYLSCVEQDGRYLLRIPRPTFHKEMLVVSQLTGNAFGFDVYGAGRYIYDLRAPSVVFLFERIEDKVLMRFLRPDIALEEKPV